MGMTPPQRNIGTMPARTAQRLIAELYERKIKVDNLVRANFPFDRLRQHLAECLF
eukprot:SAG11_NODE_4532_length_1862_cov_1.564379_1_plen_54_part_10